jgi:D-alanyl-D-alanine carboxypeptidase/D-alanyl-D-alanine-endopeptidase (penicillin-binding protein 4)
MTARRLASASLAVIMLVCGLAVTPAAVTRAATPAPSPQPPAATQVLLPIAGAGAAPTAAGLSRQLLPLLRARHLGRRVGAAVVDASTGTVLYERGGAAALTPASTTKLLTAAAALATAGADARLSTRVVRSPDQAGGSGTPSTPPARAVEIVLVGAGDPMLTALPRTSPAVAGYPDEASFQRLAADTARRLRADGVKRVRLRYDATLFAGRPAATSWQRNYVGRSVGPVSALSVDQGRVRRPGSARVRDPAADAARRFAALLGRNGIAVGAAPLPGVAPPGALTLAAARSAPLAALVERMLEASDNDVAEALARHVALATGAPPTFDGAAAAVVASVHALGVDTRGVRLYDGSGLSRANRIPALTLAQLLRVAGSAEHPQLRPVLTGLPIAGFSGTLDERFLRGPSTAGAGLVKAKTGTLRDVTSLAGVVRDANGRLLTYAFVADQMPSAQALAARDTMDRLAAALASCGCP